MKRCTLCGGKLDSQKRCTLCGLDNTKNDSMYTYMINRNSCEDEPLTHVHEEPAQRSVPKRTDIERQKQASATYKKAQYTARSTYPKKAKSSKKPTGCAAFLGIIPFIFAFIGIVGSIIEDISFDDYSEPDYWIEEEIETEYDPYAWIMDEMPEDGDYLCATLPAGIYEVGYHIPVGVYTVELKSDSYGVISVYDSWNEIYLSEFLGPEEVTVMEDVRLFEGGYFVVSAGMEVDVKTYNAQQLSIGGVVNDFQDEIQLSGELVAGIDFPAGTYNIVYKPMADKYSYLNVVVITDVVEYGYHITFDQDMGEETFYNVPLPEGATISVEEDSLEGVESLYLIPSESTSDSDPNNFYYEYWY